MSSTALMENSATAPFLTIAHADRGFDTADIIIFFNEDGITSSNTFADIKVRGLLHGERLFDKILTIHYIS